MNKTANYNLNQWEKSDRVLMEDFNSDNAKIDAAITATREAIPQFISGTYVGSGQSGEYSKRTLNLGFQPKLVFIAQEDSYVFPAGAVLVSPAKLAIIDNYQLNVEWSETGVSWWNNVSTAMLNAQNVTYRYIAIR